MMDMLPSVWARHPAALIDPVIVRGQRFVTSISNAPSDWEPRLGALGFKQVGGSWLRMGSPTPAEFHHISAEIDLIGLDVENVIDLPEEGWESGDIPPDVVSAILFLWQHRQDAIYAVLLGEHGRSYTRPEAWSVVEAALAQGPREEAETLYGLALTWMSKQGQLSKPAALFGELIGWNRPVTTNEMRRAKGELLMDEGESIDWNAPEGQQTGRLLKALHENDSGCWIYTGSPAWVGGYVVSMPVWVERKALRLPTYEASAVTALEVAATISSAPERLDDNAQNLLIALARSQSFFPHPDWVEQANEWRAVSYALSEEDWGGARYDDAIETLKHLERYLSEQCKLLYGDLPIRLVATKDLRLGLARSWAVHMNTQLYVNSNPKMWPPILSNGQPEMDLPKLLVDLDRQRASNQAEIESQLESLQKLFASDVPVLPSELFLGNSMFQRSMIGWVKSLDGRVPALTDLTFWLSFDSRLPDYFPSAKELHRNSSKALLPELSLDLSVPGEPNATEVELTLDVYSGSAVPFAFYAQNLPRIFEQLGATVEDAPSEQRRFYAVMVDARGPAHEKVAKAVGDVALFGGPSLFDTRNGMSATRARLEGRQEAVERYSRVINSLIPLVDQASQMRLGLASDVLKGVAWSKRFDDALQKVRHMESGQFRALVDQDLAKQLKRSYADWSDSYKERVTTRIHRDFLERHDSQGIAAFVVSGQSKKVVPYVAPLTGTALTQSREAELSGFAATIKSRQRVRGTTVLIDPISWVDPELCAILSGETAVSAPGSHDGPESKSNTSDSVYVDTGVVSGFAIKDIRSYDRQTLLGHAESMTDLQKKKYLTKDRIWPRKSFEEMKSEGHNFAVAFALDALWRALPRQPKSTSRVHAQAFISVIMAMRDEVGQLATSYLNRNLSDSEIRLEFGPALSKASKRAFEKANGGDAYRLKDLRVRGVGCYWNAFDPFISNRFLVEVKSQSWDSVMSSKKRTSSTVQSRVTKGTVSRIGPDYRNGKSVVPEDFIRTFCFSGTEFGNWTNQAEREKHMNFAYDSLMDFSRVMGWPPMAISLGGRLGLCIGSRGRGGARAAAAHFEPANMAINLTRMQGDGSLAHEYFHAVANHYGRIATGGNTDVMNSFGYALLKPGPVPPLPTNGLRGPLAEAFFNLLVSIMRRPAEGGDTRDISSFTRRSVMLEAALAEDGRKKDYWAQPAEMFARAGEVWFKRTMEASSEVNDYLVRGDIQGGGVYPDDEHYERIDFYMSRWLDALQLEVKQVAHPYLGEMVMPVLNSRMQARSPIGKSALKEFAKSELERLFGEQVPQLVIGDLYSRSGLYDVATDLIALDQAAADEGTFYHEAWHACSTRLLTWGEREALDDLFAPGGTMAARVADIMINLGHSQSFVSSELCSSIEIQAYAFQFWATGGMDIDEADIREFYRTKGLADGVRSVAMMFEPLEVISIFEKFKSGELATRSKLVPSEPRDAIDTSQEKIYLMLPAERVEASPRLTMGM